MKRALLFLILISMSLDLSAQDGNYYDPEDRPRFYLGLGTGINTYTGIAGISGNYIIDKTLFAQAGVGISAWGIRTSFGLRYDQSYRHGFTWGINLVRSSGIEDIEVEFQTSSGSAQEVTMRFESLSTVNLKMGYNWWFGEYNTFTINLGYSFAFREQPWAIKDGSQLSPISEQVLQLISPGGLILGFGISFALK
ncbi:hypothetical protein SAMN05661096_03846 [Marivirga sericea]|uniref:Outer membrane protein beta-barrel domain-containing protein n=1 Tax=Marivirga sericea TaxID=1028 RepID=A0A1X7LE15_9BACT|nr:hypothetical protein [Marivirga sericea]SMG51940.1 hypothetical protein SAMN05661096_03846 [Marivirga sericea]